MKWDNPHKVWNSSPGRQSSVHKSSGSRVWNTLSPNPLTLFPGDETYVPSPWIWVLWLLNIWNILESDFVTETLKNWQIILFPESWDAHKVTVIHPWTSKAVHGKEPKPTAHSHSLRWLPEKSQQRGSQHLEVAPPTPSPLPQPQKVWIMSWLQICEQNNWLLFKTIMSWGSLWQSNRWQTGTCHYLCRLSSL